MAIYNFAIRHTHARFEFIGFIKDYINKTLLYSLWFYPSEIATIYILFWSADSKLRQYFIIKK